MNLTGHTNKPGTEQQSRAWQHACQGVPHVLWLAVEGEAPWLHLSEEGRAGYSAPEGPRAASGAGCELLSDMSPGTMQENTHARIQKKYLCWQGEQKILRDEKATLEIQKRLLGLRHKQEHSF